MRLNGFYTVMLRLVLAFVPLYLIYMYISSIMAPVDVAIGHGATNVEYPNILFRYWDTLTTFLVSKVLSLVGVSNSYQGNYLTFDAGPNPLVIMIGWQCNFLLPFISYIAMIVALTKVTIKQRLIGVFGGFLLIYLGNLARITVLCLTGSWYGREVMEKYHMLIFNKGMVVWTMLVFIIWVSAIGGIKVLERCFEVSEE